MTICPLPVPMIFVLPGDLLPYHLDKTSAPTTTNWQYDHRFPLSPFSTFITYGDLLPKHLNQVLWDGKNGPYHELKLISLENGVDTQAL